ncbi:LTXXQ motif family protein [Algoriphagus ratkowskyi]|uniref:LTXXQ motif family protein n=1 Tax=Algoriphagus ratkowskyi TaxID=57028 RepID=A0A2W7RE39_9BACT|nr:Spy/CpxP family protein refolding chaperone [Algoriphagus ratkowskyi]PZX52469.1 LTXXQ motif family protein [Algoriphagus ratkowskyi]TXD76187.1 hypothetical protein ESW18_17295 [Algoriphagus ratkowskyi]
MKKLLMILSFVCLSTIGFAQGQGQGQQRGERPSTEETIKKVTKELSLTDVQVTQWTEIYDKYEGSMKDRSTAREARTKMNTELEATLTKEQLTKYTEMKKTQGPPQRKDG